MIMFALSINFNQIAFIKCVQKKLAKPCQVQNKQILSFWEVVPLQAQTTNQQMGPICPNNNHTIS